MLTQQNHSSSGKFEKPWVDQDACSDMGQCYPWLHKENSTVRHHTDIFQHVKLEII